MILIYEKGKKGSIEVIAEDLQTRLEGYGIDIHKVGVMGCSAGGHLAASLCAIDEDWAKVGDTLDAYSCKPSFAVLISPVISMDDAIVHEGSRTNLLGKREQDITLRNLFSLENMDLSSFHWILLFIFLECSVRRLLLLIHISNISFYV